MENQAELYTKELRLKWPIENELRPIFANHFMYTASGNEFVLVFGSFLPTGLVGRSEDDKEVIEFFNEALVKPETKIVMTITGAEALYGILKKHFEGIEDSYVSTNEDV